MEEEIPNLPEHRVWGHNHELRLLNAQLECFGCHPGFYGMEAVDQTVRQWGEQSGWLEIQCEFSLIWFICCVMYMYLIICEYALYCI